MITEQNIVAKYRFSFHGNAFCPHMLREVLKYSGFLCYGIDLDKWFNFLCKRNILLRLGRE